MGQRMLLNGLPLGIPLVLYFGWSLLTKLSDRISAGGSSRSRAGDCIIQDINIGSGCWIGTRSTILCQEIGSGSVVDAGSLVLNTVPSNAMVAGAPATVKKRYKPD